MYNVFKITMKRGISMAIDKDLLEVIISSGVTLIVGIGGTFFGYRGAVNGAKLQIENERKKDRQEQEEQLEFTRNAIRNFLSHEIKDNFLSLHREGNLSAMLKEHDEPFMYPTTVQRPYSFNEYNGLKHELIKFESEEMKEIIEIYDMFYLNQRKPYMQQLSRTEYKAFKKAYLKCLMKYHYNT
jgi:uncharacterized protein YigA (DUF484 family)